MSVSKRNVDSRVNSLGQNLCWDYIIIVISLQLRTSVYKYVEEVENAYGRPLKPGRNPDIAFMAHLWEPLRYASVSVHAKEG